MGNDQKKPPPIYSTPTAIISPGLNMAAVAGQACFSGPGLPAVRACHLINSAGRSGPPATKSLPAVQVCHPAKSTGCTGLSIQFFRLIPPLYPAKSTGCVDLPPTKVCRLFRSTQQSLLAVQACLPPKSTGCVGRPHGKVYRLCRPV
jgi:hypothetical protein